MENTNGPPPDEATIDFFALSAGTTEHEQTSHPDVDLEHELSQLLGSATAAHFNHSQALGSTGSTQDHGANNDYLSGLAAVLEAAGVLQDMDGHLPLTKPAPAFHSLNDKVPGFHVERYPPQPGSCANDFADLFAAHLNSPFEHQPFPSVPPTASSSSGSKSTAAPVQTAHGTPFYYPSSSTGAGPSCERTSSSPSLPSSLDRDEGSSKKGKNKASKTSETPKKKEFACEHCQKTFGRKNDAARHARIHTGDRPFVCPHDGCGKSFIQRSALHVHLRVHSGEKPHECEYPLCGRTFSDSSSLARHRRTHSGRKPYACTYTGCTKSFTRRANLIAHMAVHGPGWTIDPKVKYSFKEPPSKSDESEDPVVTESIRMFKDILAGNPPPSASSEAGPSGTDRAKGSKSSEYDHLASQVAAISANIAAAIVQLHNQEDEGDEDADYEEEEGGDYSDNDRVAEMGGLASSMQPPVRSLQVSGVRHEHVAGQEYDQRQSNSSTARSSAFTLHPEHMVFQDQLPSALPARQTRAERASPPARSNKRKASAEADRTVKWKRSD